MVDADMGADHRFEKEIRTFDIVKSYLGPLTVRYALNGKWKGNEYYRMLKWTGDGRSTHPSIRIEEEAPLVEELEKLITDYIHTCPEVVSNYRRGIEHPVTIISPPRSCPEGSSLCTELSHKNHLGYMVGERITTKLMSLEMGDADRALLSVEHYLAIDIFNCNFPTVKGRSWAQKAELKYCKWKPRENPPVQDRIRNSDTIIIIDDTMISYMGMMRISLAVRKINPECKILWAAVFGLTGQKKNDDTPGKLLFILDENW